MKKFGVIHHSRNWVFDPVIPKFDSLAEAEKYVNDFRADGYHHKDDQAEIIEIVSTHRATVVDHTESTTLYGFKEEK